MTNELKHREQPKSSTKTKAREPDTFDGSDTQKLNGFILQCNLYFRNNPAYASDEAKVTFALSYLRGLAMEYFEPAILEAGSYEPWMDNWKAFVEVLKTEFGPFDPTSDAASALEHLKMSENQRIVKYNVEFKRLSIRSHWDSMALKHRYYSGLAERIKGVMASRGKPQTLEALRELAQDIDTRYWERIREKPKNDKNPPKTSDKSDKRPTHNHQGHNHNHSKTKQYSPARRHGSHQKGPRRGPCGR